MAEFQRDIIRESTVLELGASLGRPRLLSMDDIQEGHRHVTQLGTPIRKVADRLNVCHATLSRGFKWAELSA